MDALLLALTVAVSFCGLAILAFGIIIGLAMRAAVTEMARTTRWIGNRMLAFMEPSVAARAAELDDMDAEEAQVAADEEEPKPFDYR